MRDLATICAGPKRLTYTGQFDVPFERYLAAVEINPGADRDGIQGEGG